MTIPMVTKLVSVVTIHGELPPIYLHDPRDEVVIWGHVTNEIQYISTCRRPMNSKLDEVLFCLESLTLNAKWPFDHVATWKNFISTFKRLMAAKPGRVWTYGRARKRLRRHQVLLAWYAVCLQIIREKQ